MAIFLTDISAFQIWFCDQIAIRCAQPLESVAEYAAASPTIDHETESQLALLNLHGQLHLAVPAHKTARISAAAICHVFSEPPDFSFVRLSRDIYVEAPIPTLIKMAPRLPTGKLVQLMYQLLGTFQIRCGQLVERRPLATLDELRSYVAGAKRMRGIKIIRPLLRYAIERIASPEEARVAALLFLPPRLGGRGLPKPDANHPIQTTSSSLTTPRVVDYYWKRWRVVLEYDSDAHHTGRTKIGQDSARRAQLQADGYTVITLTNHQLHRSDEFDDVVNVLLRHMGRAPKSTRLPDFEKREADLRAALYAFETKRELGL